MSKSNWTAFYKGRGWLGWGKQINRIHASYIWVKNSGSWSKDGRMSRLLLYDIPITNAKEQNTKNTKNSKMLLTIDTDNKKSPILND